MNEQNYASLEASKKMADAGIMLETDFIYNQDGKLLYRPLVPVLPGDIPAPTMAEVWRELPEGTECKKQAVETKCVTMTKDNIKVFFSENPTDALIDLLIWVRKEKP
jgi:hypothetical protein